MESKKSTHKVEIVPIALTPHPNADTLSVVTVFGYSVVVKTDSWKDIPLGAYIVPDSMVDTCRPEFNFLAGKEQWVRIRAGKFRGVLSMGLLVPAPPGAKEGDDVSEYFNISRYEPVLDMRGGDNESSPPGYFVKYDVDAFHRYGQEVFIEREPLFASEKLDGANARYAFREGRIWCGSRTNWKKEDPKSAWWIALGKAPQIEEFCRKNENLTVYGEVYGNVGDMPYGCHGNIRFAAFDIMDKDGRWLDVYEAREIGSILPWVPTISESVDYNFDKLIELSRGQSTVPGANHIREGIVVKPLRERIHPSIGRVCLKVVNSDYWEKKNKKKK